MTSSLLRNEIQKALALTNALIEVVCNFDVAIGLSHCNKRKILFDMQDCRKGFKSI
jgi:hypothetical protein